MAINTSFTGGQYIAGGYIGGQPGMATKPDPFAIAAAGLALDLDPEEFALFAERFNIYYLPNMPAGIIYGEMIKAAYEIKKRRGTIADG